LINIALVGVGKIAQDQHIPAIRNSENWTLAATVSRNHTVSGVEQFTDFHDFLTMRDDVRVVSLCMPPQVRFEYARAAIFAKRHVMLEKPPGATLAECQILYDLAQRFGVSIFATWHSRFAPMVPKAKAWLANKTVQSIRIEWKEDVHRWHPGQDWIWEAGGMGVFDPGINALSILTEIIPDAMHLRAANLDIPTNKTSPIAAQLKFHHPHTNDVRADFDWRQTGDQIWTITVHTDAGTCHLFDGGAGLSINDVHKTGGDVPLGGEYPRLYRYFNDLIQTGQSELDLRPLTHVADAFMLANRTMVDPV